VFLLPRSLDCQSVLGGPARPATCWSSSARPHPRPPTDRSVAVRSRCQPTIRSQLVIIDLSLSSRRGAVWRGVGQADYLCGVVCDVCDGLGHAVVGCYTAATGTRQRNLWAGMAQPPPFPVVLGRLNGRDGRVQPEPPIRWPLRTGPTCHSDDHCRQHHPGGAGGSGRAKRGLDADSPTFDHWRRRGQGALPLCRSTTSCPELVAARVDAAASLVCYASWWPMGRRDP